MINLKSNICKLFNCFLSIIIATIIITSLKKATNSIENCLISEQCNNSNNLFCTALTSCTGITKLLNFTKTEMPNSIKIFQNLESNATLLNINTSFNTIKNFNKQSNLKNFKNISFPLNQSLIKNHNKNNSSLNTDKNYNISTINNKINSLNISNVQ